MQPPISLTKATKHRLGMILVLALALRLMLPIASWTMNHDVMLFWSPDTTSYVEPAKSLIHSGFFADAQGKPELFRTPGYSLLLTPGIILDHLEAVTIALQIILSWATVLLVFFMSRIIFESTDSALFAASLYAIEPLSILYCSLLLSETLFTFVLTLAIYLFLSWARTGRARYLVAAALAMAVSVYVRPISYYLPLLLTLTLAGFVVLKRSSLRPLHIVLYLLISMAPLFVWQTRNYMQTGYSGFSSAQDASLYGCQAGAVLAIKNGTTVELQWELLADKIPAKLAEGPAMTVAEQLGWMRMEGIRIIKENPLIFLKVQLRGMFTTLTGPGLAKCWMLLLPERTAKKSVLWRSMIASGNDHQQVKRSDLVYVFLECLGMLLLAFFWIMALLAILYSWQDRLDLIILLMVIMGYLLLVSSAQGYSRFRQPIMPFVAVLAAYGWTQLKQKLQERFSKRATVAN